MKKNVSSLLIIALFCNAAYGFNWPVLDNHQDNSTVRRNHKIMINSLFDNALEEKPGFKYKGHWFKVRGEIPGGNNYGMGLNRDLYRRADSLKQQFDHNHHIEILPVISRSDYQHFTERCLYKCLVNGRDSGLRFRVYNADGEIEQLRQLLNTPHPQQSLKSIQSITKAPGASQSSDIPLRGILRNRSTHDLPQADRPIRHVRFVEGDLHSERDRQALEERNADRLRQNAPGSSSSLSQEHDSRSESSRVQWPVLNSHNPETPIHKQIISAILGQPGEEYLGGQFMGKRFVAHGDGLDLRYNQDFIQKLPQLRRHLANGDKIEMRHVASPENVKNWTKKALYNVYVNDRKISQFVLFNRENASNFQPFQIPNIEPTPNNSRNFHPQIRQERIEDIPTIRLGHGIRTYGSISDQEISRLMERYNNNPVLNEAFKIVEGADLARARDMKILLEGIRKNNHVRLNKEDLFNIMRHDRHIITKVANMFQAPRGDYESDYLPFLDQLNALGNHGTVYGYHGRKGIDGAIILIRENPELLQGHIPAHLQKVTGKKAIDLRIALFYIDLAKKQDIGQNVDLTKFATFCPGDYFGNNSEIKRLLAQTNFYQDGLFYAPENGYIKNGDRAVAISGNELSGLNLIWEGNRRGDREIIFADCSGFAQMVARKFHPNNTKLQQNRYMSYELAPLYDALMNKKMGTTGKFWDINGNKRELSRHEKNALSNKKHVISALSSVYDPVLNPKQNLKPGDIIIERGGGEGHVMIAVEQDPSNPSIVTILELTGFGESRGYKWRKINLLNSDRKHRVLRIKQ